jgi:hypothetical protein
MNVFKVSLNISLQVSPMLYIKGPRPARSATGSRARPGRAAQGDEVAGDQAVQAPAHADEVAGDQAVQAPAHGEEVAGDQAVQAPAGGQAVPGPSPGFCDQVLGRKHVFETCQVTWYLTEALRRNSV